MATADERNRHVSRHFAFGARFILRAVLGLTLLLFLLGLLLALHMSSGITTVGGKIRYISDSVRFGQSYTTALEKTSMRAMEKIADGSADASDYADAATWELRYGREKRAAGLLRRGIQNHPNGVDLYYYLAFIETMNGGNEEARFLMQRCPYKNYYYYWRLGDILSYSGDAPSAIGAYGKSLSILANAKQDNTARQLQGLSLQAVTDNIEMIRQDLNALHMRDIPDRIKALLKISR